MRHRRIRDWLRALQPGPLPASLADISRHALGTGLGIGCTAWLMHALALPLALQTWLVAPMGASAVLVFVLPASPLAQPWAVVAGNVLSALVAIACVHTVTDVALAAGLAVGLAVLVMGVCRCLHPPGGAVALLVVLNQVADWRFALLPVGLAAVLLVVTGMLWHPLGRHSYPHQVSRLRT